MGVNFFRRDDRDPKFVLFEVLDLERLLQCESFQDFTLDDMKMILDEGLVARGKLASIDTQSAQGVFYRGKIETVRLFSRNILVNFLFRQVALHMEDTSALDLPEEAF
jgi:hypothetical protein